MREEKGLGLRELADQAGIGPSFLSKIESGMEKAPAEVKLIALAKVLRCHPEIMIAMAGRLSSYAVETIQEYPMAFAVSLRCFVERYENIHSAR